MQLREGAGDLDSRPASQGLPGAAISIYEAQLQMLRQASLEYGAPNSNGLDFDPERDSLPIMEPGELTMYVRSSQPQHSEIGMFTRKSTGNRKAANVGAAGLCAAPMGSVPLHTAPAA